MDVVRQILFVPPAPVLWATARGSFAAHGIDVETTHTLSSDQIGRGLARGEWNVGIGVMDNVVAWNALLAAGLVILAQLERRMLLSFCAAPPCQSLADAADRPITVDATDNGFVLVLYRAFARAGIDWRRCRYDKVGGVRQRFEALIGGDAQSTILVPPFDAMAVARRCRVLWRVDDVAPAYPGVVITARRAWIQQNQDIARRYVMALRDASAWAARPENEAAAKTVLTDARYLPDAASLLVREAVPDLLPSRSGWDETIALRTECSLLPPDIAPDILDMSLIGGAVAAP